MKKVRIGVMGAYRGTSMINYCKIAGNAEVVAICDKWVEGLEKQKEQNVGLDIAYYDNFDDFIKHDMDAVVLANYAHEHAPFAIRAMKLGLHVFSEVLPVQTMKQAVELCEAVEETGMIYAYGENYCYMEGPYEMRKLYKEGKIGNLEYAEAEYIHNGETIWPSITYGDRNHWRNRMYATFYCTHSLGPIIHSTGLRPVSVTGFEGALNARGMRTGRGCGCYGIEMVTLENGAIVKSIHGGLYKNSIWYCMYGDAGRMETAREDAQQGAFGRLYVNADEYPSGYGTGKLENYLPKLTEDADIRRFGHGGSDYWSMYHFVEKIKGNKEADIIDVYEALDMFFPGLLAYRSVLNGGAPVEVPDFRDKSVREKYRNDTACTDPEVAGDQLIPIYSKGNPDIPDSVYEHAKELWRKDFESKTGYTQAAFTQSSTKRKDDGKEKEHGI
ncbi:MAG: Gfo/Idh/MocA family oxidoreductase [Clostridia bacterium]|nr:Gfo/Idh/MocA family oxidoreductase [Clostridia bacterium]